MIVVQKDTKDASQTSSAECIGRACQPKRTALSLRKDTVLAPCWSRGPAGNASLTDSCLRLRKAARAERSVSPRTASYGVVTAAAVGARAGLPALRPIARSEGECKLHHSMRVLRAAAEALASRRL